MWLSSSREVSVTSGDEREGSAGGPDRRVREGSYLRGRPLEVLTCREKQVRSIQPKSPQW